MKTRLILIRHSQPEVTLDRPATDWPLSAEGRRLCVPLAEAMTPYQPACLVASQETKARETAQLVAEQLGIPWQVAKGLHEHDRTGVPYLGDEAFQSMVRAFFAHPDEQVFGCETANQAATRFAQAVERVLQATVLDTGCVAIVAHGVVISLYVARRRRYTSEQVYTFWRGLKQPDVVVC